MCAPQGTLQDRKTFPNVVISLIEHAVADLMSDDCRKPSTFTAILHVGNVGLLECMSCVRLGSSIVSSLKNYPGRLAELYMVDLSPAAQWFLKTMLRIVSPVTQRKVIIRSSKDPTTEIPSDDGHVRLYQDSCGKDREVVAPGPNAGVQVEIPVRQHSVFESSTPWHSNHKRGCGCPIQSRTRNFRDTTDSASSSPLASWDGQQYDGVEQQDSMPTHPSGQMLTNKEHSSMPVSHRTCTDISLSASRADELSCNIGEILSGLQQMHGCSSIGAVAQIIDEAATCFACDTLCPHHRRHSLHALLPGDIQPPRRRFASHVMSPGEGGKATLNLEQQTS